jgi:hypothetical protein
MLFLNLVANNKDKYSDEDCRRAVLARKKIQVLIGRPAVRDYIRIIEKGQLTNCPVNQEDI